jgi:hypothetical protein
MFLRREGGGLVVRAVTCRPTRTCGRAWPRMKSGFLC